MHQSIPRHRSLNLSTDILPNLLLYPEEEHRRNPFLAIYMEDIEVCAVILVRSTSNLVIYILLIACFV